MSPTKTTLLHLLHASLAILTPLGAQVDTLVSYDVRTASIQTVPPPNTANPGFGHTGWNIGSAVGFADLPVVAPIDPFPGSGFTDYTPAQRLFTVTDYPIRTAVKLFLFHKDTLRQICSGVMVGQDLVLTASHCLYGYFDTTNALRFADSLLAVPDYDNGTAQAAFGFSISEQYYVPKANLSNPLAKDIALVKLRDLIGLKTGWIGIGFSDSASFYRDNLFHKFSYPASVDHIDSTRVFNGDTLYYNYGRLDHVDAPRLGYNITGIRGQSGSSLIYVDNTNFYSIGTLSWAVESDHTRITRSLFSSLASVIFGTVSTAPRGVDHPVHFALADPYPNPFNPATTIMISLPKRATVSLRIYDMLGRAVAELHDGLLSAGVHHFQFHARDLPSGAYLLRCNSDTFHDARKLLLVK